MDTLQSLAYGFSIGLQPENLFFCFTGVLLGTLVGVLPGLGPIGAISLLLPASFHMSPVAAVIMLSGIYYGSMYGGSTTSILMSIPGEAAAVVTCLDGYQMAQKGRAGVALGIAAFGSFVAGTLGLVGLTLFADPLAQFALRFGPPEYFGVLLLGLTLVVYLSGDSMIKGIMTAAFGFTLSCVGLDSIQGLPRMTFDLIYLWDGIDLVPLAVGLFGISEVLINIEATVKPEILEFKMRLSRMFPTAQDWLKAKGAMLRGSVLGFFLGVLPGGGAVVSSFVSYGIEKRLSKNPEQFGHGAIEGLAGPESANNSATAGAFVPLFTLGIPANAVMALLFGALVLHGIRPGPFLLSQHPDVFWGVISSMYIGNMMLLVLNLPLIPLWVQVLKVPQRILFPLILLLCLIGAYSVNNRIFDLLLMMFFGIVGFLFRKFRYESAPLILAFVLGPMIETNLRQTLLISKGSFAIFLSRPIAAAALALALILLIASLAPLWKRRLEIEAEA